MDERGYEVSSKGPMGRPKVARYDDIVNAWMWAAYAVGVEGKDVTITDLESGVVATLS